MRYWSLARVLAGRGHDVTWWTATWSHRRKAVRQPPRDLLEEEGFALRLVAVRPYVGDASLARLASHRDFGRTLERLATEMIASGQMERPDLILASLPPLEGAETSARLARRLDATFVLDATDLWPEAFIRLLPGPDVVRRILAPLLLGGVRRRRDATVAAADAVAATARTYLDAVLPHAVPEIASSSGTAARGGVDAGGVSGSAAPLLSVALLQQEATPEPARIPRHVCYLGAYLQEFAAARPHVAEVPGPGVESAATPYRSLACVYAGSLESGHDVETLVKAATLLGDRGTDVVIHIAGAGLDEARLRRVADRLRGSCRLAVHGRLERQACVELLDACDVGLVCVRPESRVAVPAEACDYAAAGLALVNGLPGELESLADEHHAAVRYTAGDPASLADAIAALAVDRRRLASLREGARRLAAAAFDREATYPRFADWLETVAAGLAVDDA